MLSLVVRLSNRKYDVVSSTLGEDVLPLGAFARRLGRERQHAGRAAMSIKCDRAAKLLSQGVDELQP
jgi:hypothetical protein